MEEQDQGNGQTRSDRSAEAGANGREAPSSSALAKSGAAIEDLSGDRHYLEYHFHAHQAASAEWMVRSISLREELSQPYVATIELIGSSREHPHELLGSPCFFTLKRSSYQRIVHGVVSRVEHGQRTPTRRTATVTVVPALFALSQRKGCRIFPETSVPQVIEQVLKEALPHGRQCELSLGRTDYPVREYIVQHQETELEFIRRLMADEGMWFFFEQPQDSDATSAELLVVVDRNAAAPDAKLGGANATPQLSLGRVDARPDEAITGFIRADELAPTGVRVREYDWTRGSASEGAAPTQGQTADRELYEPHGGTFWEYGKARRPQYGNSDMETQARLRWERTQAETGLAHGTSNLVGLAAGQKIRIEGHPDGLDDEWIVLSVNGQSGTGTTESASTGDYWGEFQCIRAKVPYRPRREHKPRVTGIQTALVVGPDAKPEIGDDGDDIFTDEHGRIRVKFAWDRTVPGEPGATDSCWLRVSQASAGNLWGSLFLPRIGMEVIVSFVEGDPDRPLVTGSVYGTNKPCYELPLHKSKSYIKTRSTPRGSGSNELCFDDAKDNERITLHAQKDHEEVVEHNQLRTVKADQTVNVGASQHLTVTGTRIKEVGGEKNCGEKSTIHGPRDLTVSGKNTETFQNELERSVSLAALETFGNTRTTKVKADEEHTVEQGGFALSSKKRLSLVQDGKHALTLDGKAELKTERDFAITNGKAEVQSSGEVLELAAPKAIRLRCGTSTIELKDGFITINGMELKLAAAGTSIVVKTDGITTNGKNVVTSATALHQLQGKTIKIG